MKLYVTPTFAEQWVKAFGNLPDWFMIVPPMK